MEFITDGKRHLICLPYSIPNLHKMAVELNINVCWFHGGKFPHYDIPKRRIKDVTERCRVISSKELLTIIKNNL